MELVTFPILSSLSEPFQLQHTLSHGDHSYQGSTEPFITTASAVQSCLERQRVNALAAVLCHQADLQEAQHRRHYNHRKDNIPSTDRYGDLYADEECHTVSNNDYDLNDGYFDFDAYFFPDYRHVHL